ncbi:MAG: protein-tyrosine phosphatase [Thermoleophilaceae bacterium]|jgi:protein-tyrosine phosphatase|nr:protein-tyrosine phosphatase [Thermoleophilaceae bacterium]
MERIHPGRTDIHFHVLPGVDDGPATMEESLELARLAVRDGTRTVVATPHIRREFLADPGEVPARVAELQERLGAERIPLSVVPGGELDAQMVACLTQAELDQIAVGPDGGRWLLLEAPFDGLHGLVDASAELRARGFSVVLAHPERAAGVLAGGCRILREQLAAGCLAQVSVSSLTGAHGHEAQVSGWALVDYGLAHVLASDAHSPRRAPCLEEGIDRLLAGGSTFATTRRLVDINPRELVAAGMPRRLPLAA